MHARTHTRTHTARPPVRPPNTARARVCLPTPAGADVILHVPMTEKKRLLEIGQGYCELRENTLGRSSMMQGVGRMLGLHSIFDHRLKTMTRSVRRFSP